MPIVYRPMHSHSGTHDPPISLTGGCLTQHTFSKYDQTQSHFSIRKPTSLSQSAVNSKADMTAFLSLCFFVPPHPLIPPNHSPTQLLTLALHTPPFPVDCFSFSFSFSNFYCHSPPVCRFPSRMGRFGLQNRKPFNVDKVERPVYVLVLGSDGDFVLPCVLLLSFRECLSASSASCFLTYLPLSFSTH